MTCSDKTGWLIERYFNGEWRSAESARAQKPTVREPVQAHPDKAHDGAET